MTIENIYIFFFPFLGQPRRSEVSRGLECAVIDVVVEKPLGMCIFFNTFFLSFSKFCHVGGDLFGVRLTCFKKIKIKK